MRQVNGIDDSLDIRTGIDSYFESTVTYPMDVLSSICESNHILTVPVWIFDISRLF